jgi:hypothetical protein
MISEPDRDMTTVQQIYLKTLCYIEPDSDDRVIVAI